MSDMLQTLKEGSAIQEKNSDRRLQVLLDAERKRDEMYIMYQREQAEANRKHELMMLRMLMSTGSPYHSPVNLYHGQGLPSKPLILRLL